LSNPAHAAFDVLLHGGPVRDFPGPGCLVYLDQPDSAVTYILDWFNDQRTGERLAALYPGRARRELMMHAVDPWPLYELVEVPAGARPAAPAAAASAVFGGAFRLVGYSLSAGSIAPGESLTISLHWLALSDRPLQANVFVHAYWPGGEVPEAGVSPQPVAQSDGPPCHGNYPTTDWIGGEIVVDERTLTLPGDFTGGTLPLAVGFYGWPDLARLPLTGADGGLPEPGSALPGDRLRLTEVRVTR
jgi:hypothetical protein